MRLGGGSFAGPPFLGVIFSGFFASLVYASAVAYFFLYPEDTRSRKLLVFALTAVSLLSFSDNISFGWRFLVAPPPDIDTIFSAADLPLAVLTVVVSGSLSQVFYSHRVYVVSGRRRALAALCVCLTATHMGLGLTLFVMACRSGGHIPHEMERWLIAGLGISAIDDLVLTSTLCWILRKQQKGFSRRTDRMITRVLELSVTTGAISSLFAVLAAGLLLLGIHHDQNTAGLSILLLLPQASGLMVIWTLLSRRILAASTAATECGPQKPYASDGSGQSWASSDASAATRVEARMSLPMAPSARFAQGEKAQTRQVMAWTSPPSYGDANLRYA